MNLSSVTTKNGVIRNNFILTNFEAVVLEYKPLPKCSIYECQDVISGEIIEISCYDHNELILSNGTIIKGYLPMFIYNNRGVKTKRFIVDGLPFYNDQDFQIIDIIDLDEKSCDNDHNCIKLMKQIIESCDDVIIGQVEKVLQQLLNENKPKSSRRKPPVKVPEGQGVQDGWDNLKNQIENDEELTSTF